MGSFETNNPCSQCVFTDFFFFFFFKEKDALKKENLNLKGELTNARTKITTLETQLSGVRQQSVRFMLEQMERLHTCKETDV